MITDPALSVVVPVHRTRPAFVAECLASLAAQTDRDFEVVLVDDGSGPAYRRALEELAARELAGMDVRLEVRARRGGPAAARNAGAAAARGDYLMLVDSDDITEPRLVEMVRPALRAGCALAYTQHVDAAVDGRTVALARDKRPYHALLQRFAGTADDPLVHVAWISHCMTVRRADFEAVGGYRTDLRYGEELELAVLVAERAGAAGVVLVPKVLYRYRANPESIVHRPALYRQVVEARVAIVLAAARRRGLAAVRGERLGRALATGAPHFGLYDEDGRQFRASWFDYEALCIRPGYRDA
jgi:glycosyltransferase involved in cell wall biosynthesis